MFNNDNNGPKIFTDQKQDEPTFNNQNKMLLLGVVIAVIILVVVLTFNVKEGVIFEKEVTIPTTTHPGFGDVNTSSRTTTVKTKKTTTTTRNPNRNYVDGEITSNINNSIFKLKISNLDIKTDATYELQPGKIVKIRVNSFSNNLFQFEMYYNDRRVVAEKLAYKDDLEVYLLGDAFIYINTEEGNAHYNNIYIVQNNMLKTIYEFESIKGMIPKQIVFHSDKMVVYASRVDGTSLRYGNMDGINICDQNTWKLGLNTNTIVEATYIFNVKGMNFNPNAVYSDPVKLGDYLTKNPVC